MLYVWLIPHIAYKQDRSIGKEILVFLDDYSVLVKMYFVEDI